MYIQFVIPTIFAQNFQPMTANVFVTLPKALYHPKNNPGIQTYWAIHLVNILNHNRLYSQCCRSFFINNQSFIARTNNSLTWEFPKRIPIINSKTVMGNPTLRINSNKSPCIKAKIKLTNNPRIAERINCLM